MMFYQLLPFLIIFTLGLSFSQNYKQVKIYINDYNDINNLIKDGFEFDHPYLTKDNGIIVFITDEEYEKLLNTNYKYEILIDKWFEYYESLPQLSEQEKNNFIEKSSSEYSVEGFGFGSMGGFYTFNEVIAELDSMKMLFPSLITAKQSIGNTIENRSLYMVKISDNPDINEDEPEALYTALHHAREPEGMMQMIYFIYYLLENYNSDPSVKYLVDNRELYFIPVVNPDGYEYNRSTNPNGGGMWRKNRRNNGSSYGVDLNRNYGPDNYWNAPNGGSSTLGNSQTYRGTEPFSEPETEIIRNFLSARKIKNALNYHTYGNFLIYPYGALEHETPDSSIFREFSSDMTLYNGYEAGTDQRTVGYSTRGNSDDYMYDGDIAANSGKIFAMTPEVGDFSDGFWPQQNRIFPLAQENLYSNLYYAWIAGEYLSLENPNFNQQYFNPGDFVKLNPSFKNKGLSNGYNIAVELASLNSFALINNGTSLFDSIPARSSAFVSSPLSFSIYQTAPIEEEINLLISTKINGTVLSKDTIRFIVTTFAVPVELISFTAETIGESIVLNWSTASELNNKGFEVFRKKSADKSQKSKWKLIGFVEGRGTTNEINSYIFIDKDPLIGKSLYRLKQIDYDGTFKLYSSIEIECSGIKEYSLAQNYPNPFNSSTIISWQLAVSSHISLKVYDVLGNEAAVLINKEMDAGEYEINFDSSNLPSGMYLYKMRAGNFTQTKKLMVIK